MKSATGSGKFEGHGLTFWVKGSKGIKPRNINYLVPVIGIQLRNLDKQTGFSSMLRSVLRQDLDVQFLVLQIRDKAPVHMKFALTGNLIPHLLIQPNFSTTRLIIWVSSDMLLIFLICASGRNRTFSIL